MDTAPSCWHQALGGMPGAVRGNPPCEHGARRPARERVLGGSGAGECGERAGAGRELSIGRRPSF
eukprot:10688542-Alexandrium_andersonii.AAC.1